MSYIIIIDYRSSILNHFHIHFKYNGPYSKITFLLLQTTLTFPINLVVMTCAQTLDDWGKKFNLWNHIHFLLPITFTFHIMTSVQTLGDGGKPGWGACPKGPRSTFSLHRWSFSFLDFSLSWDFQSISKRAITWIESAQLCRISSEVRHATMISMGKQRVLDNYVSVPYSPVYILVNNCFPTHIIANNQSYWWQDLALVPGAKPDNIHLFRNIQYLIINILQKLIMAGLGLGPGAVVGLTERDNEEIDSHRHLYVGFHVPKEKRTEGETDAK